MKINHISTMGRKRITGLLKITLLLVISWMIWSCEKQVDWPIKHEPVKTLVVDALITNEKKAHSVVLSSIVEDQSTKPGMVSGAEVSINDGDTLVYLKEDENNDGIYLTDSAFRGVIGKTYTLRVVYNYNTYLAKAEMKPVTPFQRLKVAKDNNDSLYYVAHVVNQFEHENPAMYHI
ncbi:MAG: DUF4249 family protein, partial [Bacteroidota bacterium]